MKYYIRRLLLFLFTLSSAVTAQDTVSWYYQDFPPFYIKQGQWKGMGTCDKVEEYVKGRLPTMEHTSYFASWKRFYKDASDGKNVACSCLIKILAWEKSVVFSIPFQLGLPNGLIIKNSSIEKLKKYVTGDGQFDLGLVHDSKLLSIGIQNSRKYGDIIDLKIKGHNDLFQSYSGSGSAQTLARLLDMGRVDAIVGFPTEAQYLHRSLGLKSKFTWIPIKGMPRYVYGRFGFPRNPWGMKMVSKVNEVIKEFVKTPQFYEYYNFWLDDYTNSIHRNYVEEFLSSKAPLVLHK